MSSAAIALRGLEKRFGSVTAVAGVDIRVPPGAFLVLLGPSGCGKTTILRMLAGLEEPTGGEIRFGDGVTDRVVADGQRGNLVASGERNIGLVFQSYALWPHMTVRQNIEWPLKVKKWPAAERSSRVEEVLKLLAMHELGSRYPGEISGGQQQRVAIARTIATRPGILLFDEPLSNLDAKLRVEMRTELLRVHQLTKATSVYVTHDQVEAMTMATHVAVMNMGKLEQFGSPRELLTAPASPFVAAFIGTPPANLLPGDVRDGLLQYRHLCMGVAKTEIAGPNWLMYRAHELGLHTTTRDNCLAVDFAEATPVAGQSIITVWDQGQRLSVMVPGLPDFQLGQRLYLEFPARPERVFKAEAAP